MSSIAPAPHESNVEARLARLEGFAQDTRDRLTRLEAKVDFAATRDDLAATREDLAALRAEMHKLINEQTWKIVGAFALLASVTFWVARNIG